MNTQRVEGHTPLNIRIAEWCADNAAIAANPKTPLGAQLEIAYKLMNEQSSGIERLEKVNEALVELAELVKRGLDSGHIKAKPIITMDPDAESLPVKCLEDFVDAALALAKEPA